MAEQTPKPALLSSLPLWVQAVSMVGFPIVVSAYYMLKDIGYIQSIPEANAKVISQILAQHEGQIAALAELRRINRAICHNTAKDNREHVGCD